MNRLFYILLLLLPVFCLGQTPNTWEKVSDFPGLKRERAISFTIDQYAYIGTGVDTSEVTHNDLWRYDPENDVWSQMADIPGEKRRNAVAFTIDDLGYVTTGITSADASDVNAVILNDLWRYSPTTNAWVQKANYPGEQGEGVYFATGFSINNKGYVCCGKKGPNNYSDKLYEYKPSTDKWIERSLFPGGVRYQLNSFTINDKAYVGFGTNQDLYNNDLWCYSPLNNSWVQKESLPGSVRSACMSFTIEASGYICMGTNGGNLDDTWEYKSNHDTWSIRANYGGSPRKGGIGFSINNIGYVGIGKGISGKKQSMYKYYPIENISGIEDHFAQKLTIYPNPVVDYIYFSQSFQGEIQFSTLSGKILTHQKGNSKMDMRNFPSGLYLLKFINQENEIVSQQKIIKW